jgi:hypothetical protein
LTPIFLEKLSDGGNNTCRVLATLIHFLGLGESEIMIGVVQLFPFLNLLMLKLLAFFALLHLRVMIIFPQFARIACLFLFSLLAACGGENKVESPQVLPKGPLAELRVLVIGQSISSNCNEHVYGPVANVFQIDGDGNIQQAKDPLYWAGCDKGSMWMPLGRKLIENGVASKVTFMSIGEGGTSVAQWQEGGMVFPKLNRAIAVIKAKGIVFDFAFWHQGSADMGMSKGEYQTRLASVVEYVNKNVSVNRWLIALHSRCAGMYDPNIEEAQREFGNAPNQRRYPGPNTNLLGDEYRMADACHLNFSGQERMADLWMYSIIQALE